MSEPMKFRKKPVVIEAMQVNADLNEDAEVYRWVKKTAGEFDLNFRDVEWINDSIVFQSGLHLLAFNLFTLGRILHTVLLEVRLHGFLVPLIEVYDLGGTDFGAGRCRDVDVVYLEPLPTDLTIFVMI